MNSINNTPKRKTMNVLQMIKTHINGNIFLLDFATRAYFCKKNTQTIKALRPIFEIDPILDFEHFKNAVEMFKARKKQDEWLGINEIGGDSPLYGHLYSLCKYANVKQSKNTRLLLPSIEHGITWLDEINPETLLPYIHCVISQGSYRHNSIRKSSAIPHYVIGPYIHYAQSCYSEQKLKEMKRKWGKTLLVFPAHTYELGKTSYSREKYVDGLLNKARNDFDTIVISAYWNDVNDPTISLFKSEGAIIVSSGLREDHNFLSRLKSLILLADATTSNTLGTNIGYSLYLEKPFLFFDAETDVRFSDLSCTEEKQYKTSSKLESVYREGKKIFSTLNPQDPELALQKHFYEKYWGGKLLIKSPEEIKTIILLSRQVIETTHGNVREFQNAYKKILSKTDNAIAYNLLSCALK